MFRPLSDQICCLTIQMLCANVSGGALCVCEWRNSYTIWINGFCGWPNNHSFFTDRMLLCVSGRMMDWIFLDHKMKTFLKTSFRNLTGIVWRFGKNALKETHKKKNSRDFLASHCGCRATSVDAEQRYWADGNSDNCDQYKCSIIIIIIIKIRFSEQNITLYNGKSLNTIIQML